MTLNGDLVPNSIFVGNLPLTVTDTELLDYFAKLTNSHLKEAKIITDQKGLSKGYGFITFDNEIEVNKVLDLSAETLFFNESKLNIANAYKRKQYNYNSYNHGASNNYSNNQIESDRLFMSPNNGHALNLMSPTPPSHLNGRQSPADNDPDEIATTSSVEKFEQNDLLKADIQQDNNNNNTVPVKLSFNKLSRNYSNESSNIDSPVSINPVNDTVTFNKKEYRQNNQRNYNNSNYRFSQFNQQQNRNQIVNQLTIQTPQPGQQLQQQHTPGQYVNGQNIQYFYAMAAGLNSPVPGPQQQQILLQNSTNKQVQYINNSNHRNKNKNEQNQSNYQANTYYNSQQNHMKGGQAATLKSQSSSSSSSSAPSSSSSSSTSSSSTSSSSALSSQTSAANSSLTNATQPAATVTSNDTTSYATNYAEYYNAAVAAHASSNGIPVNTNYGLVRAPSQPFNSQPQLVAPKPVTNQQQTQVLQNQNPQQPFTIYPNYFYMNPNVKPPPPNGIMPEYTMNQNTNGTPVASNTSIAQLPTHYQRHAQQQQAPVTYIQNQGPLTPLSYQHSGQFVNQQLYYAPSLPQMVQQQPQNSNEAIGSNQSNYTNSTITAAFETATNSASSNAAQNTVGQSSSADNLDEMMRKNLTLQPQQSNEYYSQYAAQQQPAYFYITGSQPAAYQTIAMSPMTSQTNLNPVVHQISAPNPQYYPQYYYYASNNIQQGPMTPQLQPVVPQIPANSTQSGNLQQQQGAFVPMSQNTQLHSYPIQINTMNNGGNAAPLPGPHSTSLTSQTQQQQHQISFLTPHSNYNSQQYSQQSSATHQLNTPVPLLQLPSISYLNQPQQLQSPKQQHQPGQYTQKTFQQQSVNGSNMKQMNKTEYYNHQMHQSSLKTYKPSNNIPNKNTFNNRFNTTKSYYKTNYSNKNQSYSQTPINSSNQLPQYVSQTVQSDIQTVSSNDTNTEASQEVDVK